MHYAVFFTETNIYDWILNLFIKVMIVKSMPDFYISSILSKLPRILGVALT